MKSKKTTRSDRLKALELESDLAERDQIQRLLKRPMNKRTHFLRVRLPNGGSSL